MSVNYGEIFGDKFFSQTSRTNPIGMKGHMAKCYGDLVQELWSGTQKNVAPLKLRVSRLKYYEMCNSLIFLLLLFFFFLLLLLSFILSNPNGQYYLNLMSLCKNST